MFKATPPIEETIAQLSLSSLTLRNLSVNESIELVRELMLTLYSDTWSDVDNWADKETKLFGLEGEISGKFSAMSKFIVCSSAMDFLRTMQTALEYELDSTQKPALLENVCEKHGAKVFGPIFCNTLGKDTFELWTRPSSIPDTKYIEQDQDKKKVSVVLGAGNVSSLSLIDTLHQIFIEKAPVLIKHHPLRPYLISPYEVILQPLIKKGFVAQVLDSGIPDTQKILSNPLITHVHITGALATSKAVQKFLSENRPDKTLQEIEDMVTGELGCASPFIVAPGDYKPEELKNIACMVVGAKKNNGGHNCLSPQVIVLPKGWEHGEEFKKLVIKECQEQPAHPSYYPGSSQTRQNMIDHYSTDKNDSQRVQQIACESLCGGPCKENDQIAFINCGTPGEDGYNDKAVMSEAFGPVLSVLELPYEKKENGDYLNDVVIPFVNDKSKIFGSLSCTLIVPPATVNSEPVQKAISSLRYGAVCVNQVAFYGYNAMTCGGVWGANAIDSTGQSGTGQIGNHYRIPHVEKSVVYGPDLMTAPPINNKMIMPAVVVDSLRLFFVCQGKMDFMFRISTMLCGRILDGILSKIGIKAA